MEELWWPVKCKSGMGASDPKLENERDRERGKMRERESASERQERKER